MRSEACALLDKFRPTAAQRSPGSVSAKCSPPRSTFSASCCLLGSSVRLPRCGSLRRVPSLRSRSTWAALITGAAGLLGIEHAAALLECGASVVLTDIYDEGLIKARDVLLDGENSSRIICKVMDVSKLDSIQSVSKELMSTNIRIDTWYILSCIEIHVFRF